MRPWAGEWTLDPSRSTVTLLSKSMWGLVPVRGAFRLLSGHGAVSPAGEVSGVLKVAAASIDTKVAKRDAHLRSADFFDAENHPDITFTVEGVQAAGQSVTITGLLTVRDRARPITFEAAVDVRADGEIWVDAQVQTDHTDFGITWNLFGTVAPTETLTVHAVFARR
jgi:polyisoprenoid-binding protein YceI